MSTGVQKPAVDPWLERPVVGKFRVIGCVHSEGYVPGTYRLDQLGQPMGTPRIYMDGDVVASRSDLLLHNPQYGVKRFEKVDDSTPDKYDVPNDSVIQFLQAMTAADLRMLAEKMSVDLSTANKKADVIHLIAATGVTTKQLTELVPPRE